MLVSSSHKGMPTRRIDVLARTSSCRACGSILRPGSRSVDMMWTEIEIARAYAVPVDRGSVRSLDRATRREPGSGPDKHLSSRRMGTPARIGEGRPDVTIRRLEVSGSPFGRSRFPARRACAEPVDRDLDPARGCSASHKLASSREIDLSIRDIPMPSPRIDIPAGLPFRQPEVPIRQGAVGRLQDAVRRSRDGRPGFRFTTRTQAQRTRRTQEEGRCQCCKVSEPGACAPEIQEQ